MEVDMNLEREEIKDVTIYTDGACVVNPGAGGYGVVLLFDHKRKELSGGFNLTTNNRMEIMAAIVGIEALKEPCKVKLYSDSQYLVDAMTLGWAKRWQESNWYRKKSERALNSDLWERLLKVCENHQVEFLWVKGHAGNKENERCDKLSNIAAGKSDLPDDEGYDPKAKLKVKISSEGQPCRKCGTPVIKKIPHRNRKSHKTYYFEYYFCCTNCDTSYWVEEAKKEFEDTDQQLSFLSK